MTYKVEYWTNQSSNTNPMELTVSHSGPATLLVRSNADNPEINPVGIFRGVPSQTEVDALVQACHRLVLAPKPHLEPPVPGELVRRLTISLDDGPTEMRNTVMSTAPDQPFLAAEAAALALLKVVRQHPQIALTAQTLLHLDGAGHLEVSIRVTNIGKEPLRIPHPDMWGDGSVSIQVTALRNDVPLADLRDKHQQFLDLSKPQIVGTLPSLASGRTIPIAPYRDVTFQFVADMVLSPGNYDVWLTLDTALLDAQGANIMQAELLSKSLQASIR
jgi:hypothetical protein